MIQGPPPTGYRWLRLGEKFGPHDACVVAAPYTPIHPGQVGNRVTQQDVGLFARPLVIAVEMVFGRPPLEAIVTGWQLTHLGRLTYCATC